MKVNVCDVCYYGEELIKKPHGCKLTMSKWKHTSKHGAQRIVLELCDQHKEYLKGLSFADAEAKVGKLYGFGEK